MGRRVAHAMRGVLCSTTDGGLGSDGSYVALTPWFNCVLVAKATGCVRARKLAALYCMCVHTKRVYEEFF
jgi:hypothetical protein